ncbi:MAG: hypothetical protein IVW36_10120 [Dehalococcoidia bacterium]|nr:hypothetical protein [Dehalococcoidia bacterium]
MEESGETTAQNAEIWARYFEQRWAGWLAPFVPSGATPAIAATAAARVAGLLTLAAAGPIAWLWASNGADASDAQAPEPLHLHRARRRAADDTIAA